MITLNVGNLFTDEYLDKVIELNERYGAGVRVTSMFGSIADLTPTARSADRLPRRDYGFLRNYIRRAKDAGIESRYTLNMSCIGSTQEFYQRWKALKIICKDLRNMGIREWTVTSPLVLELLRDLLPNDFIEVSTICEVSTAEDAIRWTSLGADGICLGTSANRDFDTITRIVDAGTRLSLLANEACLFRCPWRRECYNLSSHNSLRSEELFNFYPFSRCTAVRTKDPSEWVKSRLILPQWMHWYQGHTGVTNFKIAYRTHPFEVAIPMLRAYLQQYYGGNLLDLWPTIANLGGGSELKEQTYISCGRLHSIDFIEHFPQTCSRLACVVSCRYCTKAYEYAVGKD